MIKPYRVKADMSEIKIKRAMWPIVRVVGRKLAAVAILGTAIEAGVFLFVALMVLLAVAGDPNHTFKWSTTAIFDAGVHVVLLTGLAVYGAVRWAWGVWTNG